MAILKYKSAPGVYKVLRAVGTGAKEIVIEDDKLILTADGETLGEGIELDVLGDAISDATGEGLVELVR